jgi:cellulose synthase/poly-beta-1,6-N-acetylglucosamine synthase-like glycosyltransferase
MVSARRTAVPLLAAAASGHVLYPVAVILASLRRTAPPAPEPARWPAVTVVVPAYKEAALIEEKVADLLGNGYRGELEVLVVADDEPTAAAARATPARVLEPGKRLGKASAINLGVAQARGEIVVLTDANALLDPGSLERLVRWFSLPDVAGVAGDKRVLGGEESLYWRFESALKRAEGRLGTTIGLVGELAAVRRERFRPLPAELTNDDLWLALDLVQSGGRIVYEPTAVAREAPSATPQEAWERRTRVVSGGIDVLVRRRALLGPAGGFVAAQLWGHRLLRYTAAPLAHVLLVARALGRARRSRLARLFLAGHAVAAVAVVRSRRGAPLGRGGRALAEVAFLQLVGLGGLWRYLRGDRPALWPKADRSGRP